MKLAKNAFTHGLAAGEKQVGLWISLCSNFVAEVTAHAGYDWALIDMEHSPNDYFSEAKRAVAGTRYPHTVCAACPVRRGPQSLDA